MNDFLNHLATFLDLSFESPEEGPTMDLGAAPGSVAFVFWTQPVRIHGRK